MNVRIITEIICAVFSLIEAQIKLVKASIANMIMGIVFLFASFIFAMAFIVFLAMGCYLVMAPRVGPAPAAFITAGIMLVPALTLLFVGKGKMS